MGKQYGCLMTICIISLYLTEPSDSLNWTAQPANPKELIKGQDVSLTWNFSLTANEQADRQSYYGIIWKKFNPSSASYDTIGTRIFVQLVGTVQYGEPQAPHIVVDRAEAIDSATLQIKNVQSDDEGRYKIEYTVKISGPVAATQEFNLTVLVPPEIVYVSSDQVVCEGAIVKLNCNATGNPTPSITWTRVADDGTDSTPLQPLVDGKYVMNSITRNKNGTYRCKANNGVGGPVNRTVRVTVRYSASVVRIFNSSNTVSEGGSFNMTCEAPGDPEPNVQWIKVDNGQLINGSILNFTKINRHDAGQYRCQAENDCGSDSRVQSVEVYYKPDTVELSTNTTEKIDCSDMWVNFTCVASKANPAVDNFLLYEKDGGINSSKSGTWIEKLSDGGRHMYSCAARHIVENVNSSNTVILAVNVPASVNQWKTKSLRKVTARLCPVMHLGILIQP